MADGTTAAALGGKSGQSGKGEKDGAESAVVRRRLVGAAAMFSLAALLWFMGEGAPPPRVAAPQTPAAEEWQPAAESNAWDDAEERLAAAGTFAGDEYGSDGDDTVAGDTVASDGNDGVVAGNVAAQNASESESGDGNADTVDTVAAAATVGEEEYGNSFSAGVFADPKNAHALARTIDGEGWDAIVRARAGKDGAQLHQVLVVNLSDEVAVLAAKKQLGEWTNKSARQQSESELQSESEKEESEAAGFVVQVGAFSNLNLAENILRKLKGEGYAARIEATERGGVRLHRVRAFGYPTRAAAEEGRRGLRALGHAEAQVIDLR